MWQDPFETMMKLAPPGGDGYGLYGDEDGLYLGPGVPLVARQVDADGVARLVVRPQEEIAMLLNTAYEVEVDLSRRMSILQAVANALEKGEMSRAMISAAHLRIPPLWDDAAVARLRVVERLLKQNFNPDEPRDWHGRWTNGPGGAENRRPGMHGGAGPAEAAPHRPGTRPHGAAPGNHPGQAPQNGNGHPQLTPKQTAAELDNVSTLAQRNTDIDRVLANEGGVSTDTTDIGGATYFGITAASIKDYNRIIALKHPPDFDALKLDDVNPKTYVADIQAEFPNLTRKQAEDYANQRAKDMARLIYDTFDRHYKVDRIQFVPLRQQLLDIIVNPGPGEGIKMIQRVLNEGLPKNKQITVDGTLGPETRNALNQLMVNGDYNKLKNINNKLVDKRENFYRHTGTAKYRHKHLPGWIARAEKYRLH